LRASLLSAPYDAGHDPRFPRAHLL
jgi:hypothetical protein